MKNEIIDSIVNLGFSLFNLILNTVIKVLTFWIPQNQKRILIGLWRGDRFADNARYCYYELERIKGLEVYLLVNDKNIYNSLKKLNLNVVKKYSFKSIYLHLTSKYHIIDQDHKGLLGYLSVNAIRLNLWHGLPFKKIWKLDLESKQKKNKIAFFIEKVNQTIRRWCKGYCSVGRWYVFKLLTPSKYDWDFLFSKCVFSNLVKPLYCNYPRVDYLQDRIGSDLLEIEEEYLKQIKNAKNNGKKIIFYAPTFRDSADTKILGTNEINEINEFIKNMSKLNAVLMIKMHAVETSKIDDINNCIFLDAKCDISVFMKYADCLITDYSSVYFDYLVFDKPIVFYPYDYDFYVNSDRGLMVDYNEFTPGEKVYTIKELYLCISNICSGNWQDSYSSARNELKKKVWDDSYKTIGEYIKDNLL
ncbi:MAG: CDP-glycerol glycerophosphotransferase family protein [Clostridia bacterium]|nr:CDP-glycerol glycerophosphotransferase family protein [Clostridia bacterium]